MCQAGNVRAASGSDGPHRGVWVKWVTWGSLLCVVSWFLTPHNLHSGRQSVQFRSTMVRSHQGHSLPAGCGVDCAQRAHGLCVQSNKDFVDASVCLEDVSVRFS